MKITELRNSIESDEAAHNETPYLYLHCLPSSLQFLNVAGMKPFLKICRCKMVSAFFFFFLEV